MHRLFGFFFLEFFLGGGDIRLKAMIFVQLQVYAVEPLSERAGDGLISNNC